MHIEKLHDWKISIEKARKLQLKLAKKIIQDGNISSLNMIAGLDVSVNSQSEATAVAVILSYPDMTILEKSVIKGKVEFPYISGLLSFREMPITLEACEKLTLVPDLVMVDGQGIAHPRRFGLASHIGLFLDIPTIGFAKTFLYGSFQQPENTIGNYTYITQKEDEVIGAVLRTKTGVKPLFVSPGHKISLTSAIEWVLKCCRGYRLPEPTRLAHLASKGNI